MGYARDPDFAYRKCKGWPRLHRGVVEWQCKHCDEWVTGPEHEHPCGEVQA